MDSLSLSVKRAQTYAMHKGVARGGGHDRHTPATKLEKLKASQARAREASKRNGRNIDPNDGEFYPHNCIGPGCKCQ